MQNQKIELILSLIYKFNFIAVYSQFSHALNILNQNYFICGKITRTFTLHIISKIVNIIIIIVARKLTFLTTTKLRLLTSLIFAYSFTCYTLPDFFANYY